MGTVWSSGFANDIIVVTQADGTLRCSAVNVRFPKQDDVTTTFWDEKNVTVSINGTVLNLKFSLNQLNSRNESNDGGFRFTSPCLKSMRLRDDLNDITFKSNILGQDVEVKARMFLWRSDSRIVITDVDGTITKSDKRGIVMRLCNLDWTQGGVSRLFTAIQKNGYKVIYLTGRPRYEAEATRNLLHDVQQDGEVLPKGPVIVSPDGLRAAIKREVLSKSQDEDFKIPMLKQIRELFPEYHPIRKEAGPFHAGFGNRESDESTYLYFKIPWNSIFHLSKHMGRRGIVVKYEKSGEKRNVSAFFPDDYKGFSGFVDKFFPREQDSAVEGGSSSHHSHHSRTVKEYVKSLFTP